MITSLAIIAAPLVTALFAPGFLDQPLKFALTSEMIRITFPYLLLISMTGFCGAILNSYGRFAVPAFTPVFLNLSLIFAATVAAPWFEEPVFALAWGVFFAGLSNCCSSCRHCIGWTWCHGRSGIPRTRVCGGF